MVTSPAGTDDRRDRSSEVQHIAEILPLVRPPEDNARLIGPTIRKLFEAVDGTESLPHFVDHKN
jgi:hypothetical protein